MSPTLQSSSVSHMGGQNGIVTTALGDSSVLVKTPRGADVVTALAPRRLLFTVFGYCDQALLTAALREADKMMVSGEQNFFVDLSHQTGQSEEARHVMANWLRAGNHQLAPTHILFSSAVTKMFVSIVSMMVKGDAGHKYYSDLRKFESAIAAAVPGFKHLPVFDPKKF